MSLCLRPVIEKWGNSLTYSSRDTDMEDIFETIADLAGVTFTSTEYGDMMVAWVDDGKTFLDYLSSPNAFEEIVERITEDWGLSDDEAEAARQHSDIREICAAANEWRKSIDPQDGALRIYIDS